MGRAPGRAYTGAVSLSESEFYEAGMALPPDVRRHVALRLLNSVDPEAGFDAAADEWLTTHAAAAYDAVQADASRSSSSETVRGRFDAKWAARS